MASVFLLLAAQLLSTTTQAETATATLSLPWCVNWPSPAPYAPRQARAGDTVTFTWSGGSAHNAMIYPSGKCFDTQNTVVVGAQSGASYTFRTEDVGTTKTFACSVGKHCANGQIVDFFILEAGADIDFVTATPCREEVIVIIDSDSNPAPAPLVPVIAADSNSDPLPGTLPADNNSEFVPGTLLPEPSVVEFSDNIASAINDEASSGNSVVSSLATVSTMVSVLVAGIVGGFLA